MNLKSLIEILEKEPQDKVVLHGFNEPHSYRGYYEDLAFEPKDNVLVSQMLANAKGALGRTFIGYKGGEFKMSELTNVWLAEYGRLGESIGPKLLRYMLDEK